MNPAPPIDDDVHDGSGIATPTSCAAVGHRPVRSDHAVGDPAVRAHRSHHERAFDPAPDPILAFGSSTESTTVAPADTTT